MRGWISFNLLPVTASQHHVTVCSSRQNATNHHVAQQDSMLVAQKQKQVLGQAWATQQGLLEGSKQCPHCCMQWHLQPHMHRCTAAPGKAKQIACTFSFVSVSSQTETSHQLCQEGQKTKKCGKKQKKVKKCFFQQLPE